MQFNALRNYLNLRLNTSNSSPYIVAVLKIPHSLLHLLVLVAGIFGCASHQPDTCQELDWYELGRQDGNLAQNGKRRQIQVVCEISDQSLNEALYNNGFDSTATLHCTPEQALSRGLAGQSALIDCPALLRDEYNSSYKKGQRMAVLQTQKKQVSARIANLDKILKSPTLDFAKKSLINDEKIDLLEKRKQLEAQLKILETRTMQ